MGDQPVLQFKSHIEGKNADVAIWPDRIEWSEQGKMTMTRLTAAAVTLGKAGISLRKGSDTNVVPIKAISGVTTQKSGIGYTTVEVTTAGDRVAFRVTKADAEQVRDTILRLMREPGPFPAGVAPSAPAPASVAEELKKLADLRDAGVLSDQEFQAQKAKLLG